MQRPEAVIVDGKVTNGPQLRDYWLVENERKARVRRSVLYDLRDMPEKPQNEAEPPARLWRRLRADVNHLRDKVAEMRAEKKRYKRYE